MTLNNAVAALTLLAAADAVAKRPVGICIALISPVYSDIGSKYEHACEELLHSFFKNGETYFWGNPSYVEFRSYHAAADLNLEERRTARLIAIYSLIEMLKADIIDINDYT